MITLPCLAAQNRVLIGKGIGSVSTLVGSPKRTALTSNYYIVHTQISALLTSCLLSKPFLAVGEPPDVY